MGTGITLHCRKCGYSHTFFLGIGMAFPQVYEETVAEMRSGKLGDKARHFFKDHPDGDVDIEETLFRCERCGHLFQAPSLALYVPASPGTPSGSILPGNEPGRRFHSRLDHPCPECDGASSPANLQDATCPHCGSPLEAKPDVLWD